MASSFVPPPLTHPRSMCSKLPTELLARILAATSSHDPTSAAALATISKSFCEALRAAPLHLTLRDMRRPHTRAEQAAVAAAGASSKPQEPSPAVVPAVAWPKVVRGLARSFPRTASVQLQSCNIDHRGVALLSATLPHLRSLAVSKCFGVRGDVLMDRFDAEHRWKYACDDDGFCDGHPL